MNIFAIDRDPVVAAQHLVDSHCVKMTLESAQMLANCFNADLLSNLDCPKTITGRVRKHSYFNHPCSKWVRLNKSNMLWLINHAKAIDIERVARFKSKEHFVIPFIDWCLKNIDNSNVLNGEITEFVQAMPDQFKNNDSVVAYRNFYKHGKSHLHKWIRNKPVWIS